MVLGQVKKGGKGRISQSQNHGLTHGQKAMVMIDILYGPHTDLHILG